MPAIPGRNGKVGALEKARAGLNRMFYQDRVAPVSREELVEARTHGQHGHEEHHVELGHGSDAPHLER